MQQQKPEWLKHLHAMTKFAQARRESVPVLELAQMHRYVRIGGKGFRPISIHPSNPCGSLYRPDNQSSKVLSLRNLAKAIKLAREAKNCEGGPRKGNKPEHQIQAHIIQIALTRPGELASALDCSEVFEELIFLTDELRLGEDVRADLVALGKKDNRYFPVYIELKVKRLFSELDRQLAASRDKMREAGEDARAFFAAASGIDGQLIDLNGEVRVLIWPESNSGKEYPAVVNARSEKFITIGYSREDGSPYHFTLVR